MKVLLNSYGNITTGLGSEARWLWKLLPFHSYLAFKHPLVGYGNPVDQGFRPVLQSEVVNTHWYDALEGADVLFCTERPLPVELAAHAHERGIKVIVLTNPEWLAPDAEWIKYADLFIAKTAQCEQHLSALRLPYVRCQIPIDLTEFDCKERNSAQAFTFTNGHGGIHDRKGWPEIAQMLRLRPDSIKVYSQKDIPIPHISSVPHAREIYNSADVLVVPSRLEGVGLSVLEGMASGCIVVATDAPPMNEFLKAAYGEDVEKFLLPVTEVKGVKIGRQIWPSHTIDPVAALSVLDNLRKLSPEEIHKFSLAGRTYIEQNHYMSAARELWRAITEIL